MVRKSGYMASSLFFCFLLGVGFALLSGLTVSMSFKGHSCGSPRHCNVVSPMFDGQLCLLGITSKRPVGLGG